MRVVLVHNYYQLRGGEDQSFEDEAELLEAHGHEVLRFTVHNDQLHNQSSWHVAAQTFWNAKARRQLQTLLRRERPDVMHCTNLFPQLSPSVYYAARDAGVPIVQALRNYRLLCPAFSFLRNGHVCEQCALRRVAWPAVRHRCYRDSRAASAVVAGSLALHRALESGHLVSLYYTLTSFAREKFIASGFDEHRIVVKANSVSPDLGPGSGTGGYAVFVGRLSEEKGIHTVLEAWSRLPIPLPLKIVGDGPLAPAVQAATADSRIEWLGSRPLIEVLEIVGRASFLICPSVWYETFGRVIAEAYSRGTPVIASRLGAMAELVEPGVNGLLFSPGDAQALVASATTLVQDGRRLADMRLAARASYEARFTPEHNYQRLMQLYEQALGSTTPRAVAPACPVGGQIT